MEDNDREQFLAMWAEGSSVVVIRKAISRQTNLHKLREAFLTLSDKTTWKACTDVYGEFLTDEALSQFQGIYFIMQTFLFESLILIYFLFIQYRHLIASLPVFVWSAEQSISFVFTI